MVARINQVVLSAALQDTAPFLFQQWLVRNNRMRNKDHITSPNSSAAGFRAESMMAGLVESNLIDASDPNPIQHLGTQDVKSFNNQDM